MCLNQQTEKFLIIVSHQPMAKQPVNPAARFTHHYMSVPAGRRSKKGSVLLLTHFALAPCHLGTFAGAEERYLPAQ